MDWLVDADIQCPFCGETFLISVDTSQGGYETVEDCSVCCRPVTLAIRCSPGRIVALDSFAE